MIDDTYLEKFYQSGLGTPSTIYDTSLKEYKNSIRIGNIWEVDVEMLIFR